MRILDGGLLTSNLILGGDMRSATGVWLATVAIEQAITLGRDVNASKSTRMSIRGRQLMICVQV